MVHKLCKCALCASETNLELSHIIPKMAVRALKKTAIGNIRTSENPNIVIQDSEKHYMLCSQCEDLFSEYETYFSKVIFHPYLKKEASSFTYDERLFYFIISVSWRSLYLDLLDFVENHVVGIDALECLIDSEKTMREYLLHNRNDTGVIENHIFFFDDVTGVTGSVEGVNITDLRPNTTFHRGISSYTFCYEHEKTYGTITNMLGIILITRYHLGAKEKWENTLVIKGAGIIEAKGQIIESVVGNEFTHIMLAAERTANNMSQVQQSKIVERLNKAGNDLRASAVYQDWVNDQSIVRE